MFDEKIREMNHSLEPNYVPQTEKRTYTVDEIMDILGICQTTAYSLIKQNLFHSVKVGHSIRISKKSFDDWLGSSES